MIQKTERLEQRGGFVLACMIIVIISIAVWGPAVRGKPLDA